MVVTTLTIADIDVDATKETTIVTSTLYLVGVSFVTVVQASIW
jgi:hypothetical protein